MGGNTFCEGPDQYYFHQYAYEEKEYRIKDGEAIVARNVCRCNLVQGFRHSFSLWLVWYKNQGFKPPSPPHPPTCKVAANV